MTAGNTLEQVLDHSPSIIFTKDLAGRYLFVNLEFARLMGVERERILGHTAEELFGPETAECIARSDRRVLAEARGIEVDDEFEVGGERRAFQSSLFPLRAADGAVCGVGGIMLDVTARKRTEHALRRAALAVTDGGVTDLFQQLACDLAQILDVDVGFIAVFADGTRTQMRTLGLHVDGAACAGVTYLLCNTPCETVVGRQFQFYGSGARSLFPQDATLARLGIESYAAYPLSDRAGESLGLIGVLHRRPMRDSGIAESVLKIFAVRAAAELERARTEAALRDSEARYRDMFNAAADALVLRDADFRIVDVNPAYLAMSGLSRSAVIGSDSVHAYRTDPATLASIKARHRQVLEGRAVQTEVQRIHKSGAEIDLELRCVPLQYQGRPHVLYICRDISDRKRAEDALRASEEQYRAIFHAAADALVLRDAEFRIVDVNPAFLAMSGYTGEEVVGKDHLITNPPAHDDAIRALHRRALAGEPVQIETESRARDGRSFELELRGVPIQHCGGPHVLYIGRDISERKRAEAALRASEEQYRAIFNSAQDSMVLRDADFRIVDVNEAFVSGNGFSREETIGQARVLGVDPPEFEQMLRAGHARVLAGEPFHIETPRTRKDGRRIFLELHAVRIQHRGQPHVLYIGRDITERKRVEEKLRASHEQYRSIFDATTDALVLRDAEARVVDVNPAFLQMSGYTREEVVGQGRWVFALPELSVRAREMHSRVIAGESVHFEIKARRKDGTPMDIEMHAVPIRYRGVPHALGMARDITAKKRAEAERAQLEAQLRQAHKMEAIGHLTGGIAHDFNNILTGILGYAHLAAERPASAADPKLSRALEEIELSSNRARELIQQMLVFSRGRRGAARAVALAPLVRQAIRLARAALPPTVEISAELASDLPAALLDPVQADQVLMNLCINARDAMQGRGIVRVRLAPVTLHETICASCRGRVSGTFVQLSVADAGPGIPPEVMDRMFEPFFSTKQVGQGTGMGLSIVHGIVHEYGGHIVVESTPGGADFRLLFPAVAAQNGDEQPAAPDALPAHPQLSGRVLLVDDEDVVVGFMRERLQGWGLNVTALSSAPEARDVFSRAPQDYDMVVTDYAMPRMNGLELARALRAVRPALPLILYSAYADSIPEAQLHIADVELLHKPIDEAALLAALRRHLHAAA